MNFAGDISQNKTLENHRPQERITPNFHLNIKSNILPPKVMQSNDLQNLNITTKNILQSLKNF